MKPALRTTLRRTVASGAVLAAAMMSVVGTVPVSATPAAERPVRSICPESEQDSSCQLSVPLGADDRPLSVSAATSAGGQPLMAADLQDAYGLPSDLLGHGQTIAVVVPFDHPTAEADLAVYRETNELPPCDENFPCLRKVGQRGGDELPVVNPEWSLHAAVGLDLASAACPNCTLLLVEADDASWANLGLAVDQAAAQGADVILPMWGIPEYDGQQDAAGHFDHPGSVVVSASGSGFGNGAGRQMLPAAYDSVIAVGGTVLFRDDATSRGWQEHAWSGSGSGCSLYQERPVWQREGDCGDWRGVADVAAVASDLSLVSVYESTHLSGWGFVAGTPVAAAIVAGIYGLAANAELIDPSRHLYRNSRRLHDITEGGNGTCGSYMCTARRGYDGPTGLGTPNGIGAF